MKGLKKIGQDVTVKLLLAAKRLDKTSAHRPVDGIAVYGFHSKYVHVHRYLMTSSPRGQNGILSSHVNNTLRSGR